MESSFLSRSSTGLADPLSDVLSLLKPRGYMSGGVDAGGDWSVRFAEDGIFRCFAVVSGGCWLRMDGIPGEVRLREGEFLVLPHGKSFCLAGDLGVDPVDIMSIIQEPLNGRILTWQGGGSCLALSALFTFGGDQAEMLLGVLPPLVHIQNDEDRAALRWYLERMMQVIRAPQQGGLLMGECLAHMLLIEILRLHIADGPAGGAGWLSGLGDKQVGAAMAALHGDPGHRWTLLELAELVGMSRSAFARRFKEKVGMGAMEYLTRWRMMRAVERLRDSGDTVYDVAMSLGYESESAFAFAFKREMGCSPRRYAREKRPVAPREGARETRREVAVPA